MEYYAAIKKEKVSITPEEIQGVLMRRNQKEFCKAGGERGVVSVEEKKIHRHAWNIAGRGNEIPSRRPLGMVGVGGWRRGD
jgi:hypothetical protein